jgi:hypothetical protein
MNLVSFLFFVAWILPAVHSQEDEGNLRASQAQMQEHLQQKLDQTLRNLNEEFQGGDRKLFFLKSIIEGRACRRVESNFPFPVNCACNLKYLSLSFDFQCIANGRLNVGGISGGLEAYSGAFNLNPFKFGYKVLAEVCIKEGTFNNDSLEDLCVGRSQCFGIGIDEDGVPCGCEARYGTETCGCKSCTGGLSVDCGIIPVLPAICFPFAGHYWLTPTPA